MGRLCVQFISEAHNKHAREFFIWRVPELYDRNVAVSYQTLLSVNFREGQGTRLVYGIYLTIVFTV